MDTNLTFANYRRAAALFAHQIQAESDPEAATTAIHAVIEEARHRGELEGLPLAVVIQALNAAPHLGELLAEFQAQAAAGALAESQGGDWLGPGIEDGDSVA